MPKESKPKTFAGDPAKLPIALRPLTKHKRWLVWRWEWNGKKWDKPPYRADKPLKNAATNNPKTWSSYAAAVKAVKSGEADGLGYVLTASDVAAEDLDHCRDRDSGKLTPWAEELVAEAKAVGAYVETTVSGSGLRIIGTAANGEDFNTKLRLDDGGAIELYRRAVRYITVSGLQIGQCRKLPNIDALLDNTCKRYNGSSKANKNDGKSSSNYRPLDDKEIAAFLAATPADDYWIWFENGCALAKRYGDEAGFAIWDPWSATSAKYNPRQCARKWSECLKVNGYTDGTIIYHANNAKRAANPEPEKGSDDDVAIKRLAALSMVNYERERKSAAEELGVRASILDKLVQAERPKDDEDKQGQAISFPEPEPWPETVDGAALLDSLAQAISTYVVLADHSRDAAALWVLHSYLIELFLVSPRLGVSSPVKRCGKTTLLDVLGRLVVRPLPTANVTSSAVFRVVEAYRPTLLVDEADTFLRDNDELRGIINSGHRHGGTVLRTVGDDYEPRAFSTYSACAIALIGHLPDTLHDRAVVIELKRRLQTEPVRMFRPDRADALAVLTRQAARWARDHAEQVGGAEPAMPDGVFNREADNWRPLLAIAQVAGGDWPSRATAAVLGCHIADEEERLAMLLADIRAAFAAHAAKENVADKERLSSSALVEALHELEGRPWAEFGKSRKPISQNQLARLLKPLAICPEVVRLNEKPARAYQLFQFSDAFDRYLPSAGASQPQQRNECDEIRTSGDSQPLHPEPDVTVVKSKKPNSDGLCNSVAVAKGGLSERRIKLLIAEATSELYVRHEWPSQPSPQEFEVEIRRLLEGKVLPEAIDSEAERVMRSLFEGEEAPKTAGKKPS